MRLFLIDGIGPVFHGYERETFNWSKIPFERFESDGVLFYNSEFERRDRLLIFRTWSVGAYRIGDLIWHRDTLRRAMRKTRFRSETGNGAIAACVFTGVRASARLTRARRAR